ncbi:hypothetical protein Tco_1037907, partial [Tanacetum coccineum]
MSTGHSARVTEAMALSDSALSPILDTDSEEDEIGEEDIDEDGGDESLDTDNDED